jgi:hypothetical protein
VQMRLGCVLHWYGTAPGAASCQGRKLLIDFPAIVTSCVARAWRFSLREGNLSFRMTSDKKRT